MRVLEVTSSEAVAKTQQFIVFILEHGFAVQNLLALLRHHFADACASRLEVVNDVFRFVEFGAVLEHREAYSVSERIANAMRGHRAVAIVDGDLFGLEFYLTVSDLRLAIQPDEFAIDADPDRISGCIIDCSLDVAARRWNGIGLNIRTVRSNIQAIRGVIIKRVGWYGNCILPHG